MSLVGESIARATAAGIRAARLAPFVHGDPQLRQATRARLLEDGSDRARTLLAELEDRWRLVDAGLPAWRSAP